MKPKPVLVCVALFAFVPPLHAQDVPPTVKVFVLAGQSNMVGQAPNALYDHQATDPKTAELFAHLRADDKWIVRDDVFIKFLGRHARLTLGFGAGGRTGPELEFGHVMGEHCKEPVILVKAAWGGHSLYRQFRPPAAGLPPEEALRKELQRSQESILKSKAKKKPRLPTIEDIKNVYGSSYRTMLAEVKQVMDDPGALFAPLKGARPVLAGFVWFQGWNDQYDGADKEYAANMAHLIRDVRKDLAAPRLPVVIGVMGQNGSAPAKGAMLTIQKAQLAMMDIPEFRGNVTAVRTDVLVDKAAEALYPKWKENFEQWQKTGGDHPYHYLGSAIWFNRIGKALGEAMVELTAMER
jgi:alpha-galactosidase